MVLIFIIISGLDCKLPFAKEKQSDFPSMEEYRKGTGALAIDFGGLIKEVPENNPFQIPVEVRNEGASDIKEAYVFINTGEYADALESEDFVKIDVKEAITKEFSFVGRSPENPDGQREIVFLNAQALSAGTEDSVSSEIKATACFDYKTIAKADVCIDTEKYKPGRFGARACEVKDISMQSQGAPLAVTKIKTDILYVDKDHIKPYFEITVENKGNGDVFKLDSGQSVKNSCLGSIGKNYNKAVVEASLTGEEKKLKCSMGQEAKEAYFKEGESIVTCQGDPIPTDKPAFLTPLYIEVYYGYVLTESANVKIKNIRVGECMIDFPFGSKCNDLPGTKCDAPDFTKEPIETRDCAWGCCEFVGGR